ncbi:MAG: KOW domain-containing RNA-binding protein [Tissierellia bacterium]|nr:KOW domain-containing RNA-binding protein [Tissierellia bacterium]
MELTTDMTVGQVVKSKSGRDKGRIFLVYKIVDDKMVLIVDGKLRGVERPKLKKIKHLMVYKDIIKNIVDDSIPASMNNAMIRECLRPYNTKDV